MKKRPFLFIIIMCAALYAAAQTPGYQGKRFSFNYSLYAGLALNNPNSSGNWGFSSFNTCHYGNLDMAAGQRKSIGMSFQYVNTAFSFSEPYSVPTTGNYNYNDNNNVTSSSIGRIDATSFGIYTRFFFKGNIAPLGTYFKPGIALTFYTVSPGNPVPRFDRPENLKPDFTNLSPYKTLTVSIEMGRNRILFNRMFIDYGVRVVLYPGMARTQDAHIDNSNYLQYVPLKRLAALEIFTAKFGVGVLLF